MKVLQYEIEARGLPFTVASMYHKHKFSTGLRLNCRICGVALNFIRKQRGTYLASTINNRHIHGPEQEEAKRRWQQRCTERNQIDR